MTVNVKTMSANYNNTFITGLLKDVYNAIALGAEKDYKNSAYVLGLNINLDKYDDLIELSEILERALRCEDCYSDLNIEEIINISKNKINKC